MMKCPSCGAKITAKHYDPEYQWYECPNCENSFTADEIEEAAHGTSPGKRAREAKPSKKKPTSNRPVAASKKRKAGDEEALAKHEAEALKPRKAVGADKPKHRDEVPTGEILNVWADEIENIGQDVGQRIDRLNAKEFFAMNLWRDLSYKHGVKARDKKISVPHCAEHA